MGAVMTMVPDAQESDPHGEGRGVVHTEVIAPGSLDARPFEFRDALTVRQAATEAARELGYRTKNARIPERRPDPARLGPDVG